MIRAFIVSCLAAAAPAGAAAGGSAACQAKSAPVLPAIVELYTSEGCNSCPPADRWLSTLRGRTDVITLAFHVDYWDRLGWKDRFASPAFTERQQQLQHASGARFVYTPQVVVNGRDWRGWPSALPAGSRSEADVEIARHGSRIEAKVTPRGTARSKLAAYWAIVEDGHASEVRAGENAGVTLHHDAVVRLYRTLPAWPGNEAQRFEFELPAQRAGTQTWRLVVVVVDATTLQPIGAAKLDC